MNPTVHPPNVNAPEPLVQLRDDYLRVIDLEMEHHRSRIKTLFDSFMTALHSYQPQPPLELHPARCGFAVVDWTGVVHCHGGRQTDGHAKARASEHESD